MINLLPPEEKEGLIKEENWKLVLILGILVLFFLVSFSLILFSIKIFISGEVEAQKILFEEREKEFQNPQIQNLQENLIALNKIIFQLDSFYQKQLNLSEILEQISKTLPSEIYLTNLSIFPQTEEEQIINCSLSGFSPTREILLEFKKNLEKEEKFQEIYFPPANWVKPSDINFTINFKVE